MKASRAGTRAGTESTLTTADRLAQIKYRVRMGYPGSKGKALKFEQAKADVAALVVEVENLKRAIEGFLTPVAAIRESIRLVERSLAPRNDNAVEAAHGGIDDRREDQGTGADRGAARSD